MDKQITIIHLTNIAKFLPHNNGIFEVLGLENQEIKDIEDRYPDKETQRYEVLRKWVDKLGAQATYNKLERVLSDVKAEEAAKKVRELVEADGHGANPTSRVLQSATLSHSTTDQDSTDSANAGSSQIPQTMGSSQLDSHNQASAGVNRAEDTSETPMYSYPDDTDKNILKAVPYSSKLKDKVDSVSIIIQACNEKEFRATLSEMDGDILPVALGKDGDGITIYLGEFGTYQCALVETKQGNDCEKYIKKVLGVCKNTVLVLGLGVAAGLKNDDLNYADVLVPTQVQHYDRARIEDDYATPRGQKLDVANCVYNVFISTHSVKWDFQCTVEGRISKQQKGLLLSGPYLLDSKTYAEGMQKKNSDAIGYEMEANVLQKINKKKKFRHLKVMIIKGICDFAGLKGPKDKKWQYTAAKAAANYAKGRLLLNTEVFKPANAGSSQIPQTIGSSQVDSHNQASAGVNREITPKKIPGERCLTHYCRCGKCELKTLIIQGCPSYCDSPDTFPSLNVDHLDESAVKELQFTLREEGKKMSRQFATLTRNFSALMKNVPLDSMKQFLSSITWIDNHNIKVPVLHDRYDEINNASTHDGLMKIIKDYITWFNCSLLEEIVQYCDAVKKEDHDTFIKCLESYKEECISYCKRGIFECPWNMSSFKSTEERPMKLFCLLVDKELISNMTELHLFEGELISKLGIKRCSFKMCYIGSGCIELIYLLPTCVHKRVFPLSKEQLLGLKRLGVTNICTEGPTISDLQYKEIDQLLQNVEYSTSTMNQCSKAETETQVSEKSHEELVKTLFSADAQVNLHSDSESLSLILASKDGNEEVVKTLLSASAQVNQQDEVIMEILDEDIHTISGYDFEWRLVGRRLLVGHPQQVTDIDRQGGSEREKRENVLFAWKRTKTRGATYSKLVEALRNLDNNATADRVEALKTTRQQANAGSSQIPQTMGSSQVDSHNQASAGVIRDNQLEPPPLSSSSSVIKPDNQLEPPPLPSSSSVIKPSVPGNKLEGMGKGDNAVPPTMTSTGDQPLKDRESEGDDTKLKSKKKGRVTGLAARLANLSLQDQQNEVHEGEENGNRDVPENVGSVPGLEDENSDENGDDDRNVSSHLMDSPPEREVLKNFFLTASIKGTWKPTTYLFVVPRGSRNIYFYQNIGGEQHAEDIFLSELQRGCFKNVEEFDLYMNYTPCHKQIKGSKGCCDKLLENLPRNTKFNIYAIAVYGYPNCDEDERKRKLQQLMENGSITVTAFDEDKEKELLLLLELREGPIEVDAGLGVFRELWDELNREKSSNTKIFNIRKLKLKEALSLK